MPEERGVAFALIRLGRIRRYERALLFLLRRKFGLVLRTSSASQITHCVRGLPFSFAEK
jgi:hypothetical protein